MNSQIWLEISEHYKIAKQCLWGSDTPEEWHRDEEQGMFHLWQAYYTAINEEEKKPLLYARVLMMMAHAQHNPSPYDVFYKYIKPAKEAYEQALASGGAPTEKEMARVRSWYSNLKYELDKTADTPEQLEDAYSLIPGLSNISDFQFHDSQVVYFMHDNIRAKLSLDYDGTLVTFEFTDVLDIQISCDPLSNWVNDFYCYRQLYSADMITFDIGFYKIMCKNIRIAMEENDT